MIFFVLIPTVFFFPLSFKHSVLFLSQLSQNKICEDPPKWNMLVAYLPQLRLYSKTDTSSFTLEQTHTHSPPCAVRWCSHSL